MSASSTTPAKLLDRHFTLEEPPKGDGSTIFVRLLEGLRRLASLGFGDQLLWAREIRDLLAVKFGIRFSCGPRTFSRALAAAIAHTPLLVLEGRRYRVRLGDLLLVDSELLREIALLNSSGSLLWEKASQVGDEITSVAAGTAQFGNRVIVGGAQRTSDNPVRTDGAVWVYIADGESVFIQPPTTLRAPFTPDEVDPDLLNIRSEWVRALVTQPGTGTVLAVGEREFKPNKDVTYSRTFSIRVHPLGEAVGTPWTSPANASFVHDAARSVTLCGDGFLAGGWTRDEPPDAKPQPMIFWLGGDGVSTEHRSEPQLPSTQINGIACDREGKIVSAGVRSMGPPDAQVFAVTDPFGTRIQYEAGVVGEDGAGAVACDWWGFCGWGGYRTADAKPYAVVRLHHP